MSPQNHPDRWYEERYRGQYPAKLKCILGGHIWAECWHLEGYAGPFAAYCQGCGEHRMKSPLTGRRHMNFGGPYG